jgi:hypothetical protein
MVMVMMLGMMGSFRTGQGSGFKSSRFKVQRFKVQGSRHKVQGSRFKVQGTRFKVQGSGFSVQKLVIRSMVGTAHPT